MRQNGRRQIASFLYSESNRAVQFDFLAKVDGLQYQACDSIIQGLLKEVEATLGAGSSAGSPLEGRVPAPPWWLLGVTAFALLLLLGDVIARVFRG